MAHENENGAEGDGRDAADGAVPRPDAYSKRRSNWPIWVAVILLVLVTLYALVSGFGYASR